MKLSFSHYKLTGGTWRQAEGLYQPTNDQKKDIVRQVLCLLVYRKGKWEQNSLFCFFIAVFPTFVVFERSFLDIYSPLTYVSSMFTLLHPLKTILHRTLRNIVDSSSGHINGLRRSCHAADECFSNCVGYELPLNTENKLSCQCLISLIDVPLDSIPPSVQGVRKYNLPNKLIISANTFPFVYHPLIRSRINQFRLIKSTCLEKYRNKRSDFIAANLQ